MRSEPTTSELQALATRQQQQLDTQARLIAARENRLRQVNYCCEEKKTNAKHFFFISVFQLNGLAFYLLIVCKCCSKKKR